MRLALDDIAAMNRRSILGFLWESGSYIFMVVALSPLYALLMNMELEWYIVYFSGGWLVWRFMSGIISSSCATYTSAAKYINQTKLPYSIYSYTLVLSHFYRFLLNLPVFLVVILMYADITRIDIAGLLVALFIFILMGFSLSIIIGYITLKIRDIRVIVENIMRIAFFITPVIWLDKTVTDLSAGSLKIAAKAAYLDYNPLYHYLIVMRAPLLGEQVPSLSLQIVIVSTAILFMVSIFMLKKVQQNIPYLV